MSYCLYSVKRDARYRENVLTFQRSAHVIFLIPASSPRVTRAVGVASRDLGSFRSDSGFRVARSVFVNQPVEL